MVLKANMSKAIKIPCDISVNIYLDYTD